MSARTFQTRGDPVVAECCTDQIQRDIYQCLRNQINCNYGISMGCAGTFCAHPMRKEWQHRHTVHESCGDQSGPGRGQG
ncbi:MAG TPA: hypothetical protein VIH45_03760 [Desulfuromonadaceae bacterium]